MNSKPRWIAVRNGSGEAIPPHAAMEPVSIGNDGILLVTKPYKNNSNSALINGEAEIAINGGGFGTYGWPVIAYYPSSSPTATNGQRIGTRNGYWELHPSYEGFIVWGQKSSSQYVVQRDVTCVTTGGGSGSGSGTACNQPSCCNWCCDSATAPPATLTGSVTSLCGSYTQVMNVGLCGNWLNSIHGCDPLDVNANWFELISWSGSTAGAAIAGSCSICGSYFTVWGQELYSLNLTGMRRNDLTFNGCAGASGTQDGTCAWKVSGQFRDATRNYTFCAMPIVVSCSPFYAYSRLTIICNDAGGTPNLCEWAMSECSACVGNEVLIEITE